MLYLASQFLWFLIAAAMIGLVMGWIARGGGPLRFWNPAWSVIAIIWGFGAAIAWFQFANGVTAAWIETALLFVAVYWLGCAGGSLLAAPRRAVSTLSGVSVEPAKLEPPLPPPAEPALPPVADEASHPGQRPTGLPAARAAGPDDLKAIKGIGRQNERRLNGLGIWHLDQIASWTPANIDWVGSYLAFPGRIEREGWVAQAQALSKAQSGTKAEKPDPTSE